MTPGSPDPTPALGTLTAELYAELRRLAARQLRAHPAGDELQPAELVHEVYLRLADTPAFRGRAHFLLVAVVAMRHTLADHARGRLRVKRGRGRRPVGLPADGPADARLEAEVVDVLDAVAALAAVAPTQARLVELHVFDGLTMDRAAAELGLPVRSVERQWAAARAWLAGQFGGRQ